MENYKQKLRSIRNMIFDVDGVFTDGIVLLMPDGQQIRSSNVKDGYVVQLAVKKGFRLAVITGGDSEAVRERFKGLGMKDVFLNSKDKWQVYSDYMAQHKLKPEETLYMGDDIVDIRVLKDVAVGCCPADAAHEVRQICDYVSHLPGGKGCVRDVVEQVLKVQGLWMDKDSLEW